MISEKLVVNLWPFVFKNKIHERFMVKAETTDETVTFSKTAPETQG